MRHRRLHESAADPPNWSAVNTPLAALVISHQSRVEADHIDDLGHMNVRYYGMNAHEATLTMCDQLGIGDRCILSTYTRHHHEQLEGAELEVRSAVAIETGPGLWLYHELRNRATNDLAATFVHELDHPGLDGHAEVPAVSLPDYGWPRTLRLDSNGLTSAPPMSQLVAGGHAARRPRAVDREDTRGSDTVAPWLAKNLIWGGEHVEAGDSDWIRTLPRGERYAFVVMETRMWIRKEPITVGTPIQSFRARLEVGTKIEREIAWVYDSSTAEPLAAIESVELCFSMDHRRSMAIPAHDRAEREADLHPELAPS